MDAEQQPTAAPPRAWDGAYAPAVLRCGYLRHQRVGRQRFRAKRSYRLIGVIEGVLTLDSAQEQASLQPGSLLLLPPGGDWRVRYGPSSAVLIAVFDVVPAPRRRSTRGDWVHVEPAQPQPPPRRVWGVDLPLSVPEPLTSAGFGCLHLIRSMYWRSPAGYARACGHLGAFLGDLAYHCTHVHHSDTTPQAESAVLQRALQFLDDPRAAPLSAAAVADLVGTSREHLSRLARRQLGRSLREVIQTRRREMACRLLLDTDRHIASIASDLGYRSEASFYRAFRRWLGVTPSDFRRRR